MFEKRDEFQLWLSEVKKINIEIINLAEEKRIFEDFIEDYNTSTMPKPIYYDIKLYEQYIASKQTNLKEKKV